MSGRAIGDELDSGEQMASQLTSPTALRKLVLNYLIHYCYIDTAQAFAHDGITSPPQPRNQTESSAAASGSKRAGESPRNPYLTASSSSQATGSSRLPRHHTLGPAHPLSAPPLSREDSSMEIEVDNLLSLAGGRGEEGETVIPGNGHTNGNSDRLAANGDDGEDTKMGEGSNGSRQVLDLVGENSNEELSADELRSVRVRKEIKEHILAGRIKSAVELCNAHFPTVLNSDSAFSNGDEAELSKALKSSKEADSLSEGVTRILPANPTSLYPAHLSLNLQIQAFIESVRLAFTATPTNGTTTQNLTSVGNALGGLSVPSHTMAPGIANVISRSASPAPSSTSSNGSNTSANGMSGSAHSNGSTAAALNPFLHAALSHAQLLNTNVQKLPLYWRSMYLKELESVMVLLAYTDLERSPVRKYLDQSRRVALAEQINSAIMFRTGKPSQPLIESAVRQTSFLWSTLSSEKVVVASDHPIFTSGTVVGLDKFEAQSTDRLKTKGKILPPWNLHSFLSER